MRQKLCEIVFWISKASFNNTGLKQKPVVDPGLYVGCREINQTWGNQYIMRSHLATY
jgi:hypothetical protein